jgi:hypothetical protein
MTRSVLAGRGVARAALVVVALGGSAVVHATTTLLLQTGTIQPDGRRLSSFEGPVALGTPRRIVFEGPTSALMTRSGAVLTTVARTGDPLPPGLTGTFNAFFDPVIDDAGHVAFRATLNSDDATSGLFLWDGATMTPVVLTGGTSGGPVRVSEAPDINNTGKILYLDRTSALWVYDIASTTNTLLLSSGDAVPGGQIARFGRRVVLNDAGVAAFVGDLSGPSDGVFTIDTGSLAVTQVALEGQPTPIGGTYSGITAATQLSINAGGRVAFVTTAALPGPDPEVVFRWDPVGPTVVSMAKNGDLLGASPISINREFVGIDPSGDVAFEIKGQLARSDGATLTAIATLTASPSDFAPRFTGAGGIVWRSSQGVQQLIGGVVTTVLAPTDATPYGTGFVGREPSLNGGDVAVFRSNQTALYQLDAGVVSALASPGGVGPGGGTLQGVFGHAARGSSVALWSTEVGAETIAVRRGVAPFRVVSRAGDPIPGSVDTVAFTGVFDVSESGRVGFVSYTTGGEALLLGSLFAQPKVLAQTGDLLPNGNALDGIDAVQMAGSAIVALVTDQSGSTSIVAVGSKGGIRPVATDGEVAPGTGGGTLDVGGLDVMDFAAGAGRVAFHASATGGTPASGVFRWRKGTLALAVGEGAPAPVPGTTPTFAPFAQFEPIAIDRGRVAFFGTGTAVEGDTTGFFGVDATGVFPIVTDKDAIVPSGSFTSLDNGLPFSYAQRTLVYDSPVVGIGAHDALLASRP